MGELIEEYGKVIVVTIIGCLVLAVIAFSWDSIGNYMIFLNRTLHGGAV